MSGLLGARTRELDLAADHLSTVASEFERIRVEAARAVATISRNWAGGDFADLSRTWQRVGSPGLSAGQGVVEAMSTALRGQSGQQRQTSGGSPGPGGPGIFY